MATIEAQEAVKLSQNWGVSFSDYKVDGSEVDFQDLMIAISERRAVVVEGEVTPLTTRIQNRNKELDKLGAVLSELTSIQASFDSDAKGARDMGGWMSNTTGDYLKNVLGYSCTTYSSESSRPDGTESRANFYYAAWCSSSCYSANKQTIEGMIQKVKSTIDGLNNKAQTDMTRLQSLVDRRDESYSTASNLMSAVSDTRSNLIRNLA
ncbi:MAG: hypothetical protein IJQ34_04235 [Kiritimatiellae bacterium]|nr:hypothetical protein [Kiritimatiellia bacterium]